MSITEQLVKRWADRWYQDDGHVQLLSSEEAAHVLLDEICDVLKVKRTDPRLIIPSIKADKEIISAMLRNCKKLLVRDSPYVVVKNKNGWGNCQCGYQMKYKPHCRNFCSRCGKKLVWK